ncbi:hypothetical protein FA13DRAFT_1737493, partial [Coprinellus micaceus]
NSDSKTLRRLAHPLTLLLFQLESPQPAKPLSTNPTCITNSHSSAHAMHGRGAPLASFVPDAITMWWGTVLGV